MEGQSTQVHLADIMDESEHESGFGSTGKISFSFSGGIDDEGSGKLIWKGLPSPGRLVPINLRKPSESFAPPPMRSMANELVAPNWTSLQLS